MKGKIYELVLFVRCRAFEISWAIGLKLSEGFSRPIISTLTVIGMILSFYFLSIALKNIPLGTAYAVWTGIGMIGTVILWIILFKEPASAMRLACILMVLFGITGLKIL